MSTRSRHFLTGEGSGDKLTLIMQHPTSHVYYEARPLARRQLTDYLVSFCFVTKLVHTSQRLISDCRQASQNLFETSHSTTAEARISSLNRSEAVLDTLKPITKHKQGSKNEVGGVGSPIRSLKETPKRWPETTPASQNHIQNRCTANIICEDARKPTKVLKTMQMRPWNCPNSQNNKCY